MVFYLAYFEVSVWRCGSGSRLRIIPTRHSRFNLGHQARPLSDLSDHGVRVGSGPVEGRSVTAAVAGGRVLAPDDVLDVLSYQRDGHCNEKCSVWEGGSWEISVIDQKEGGASRPEREREESKTCQKERKC